MTRTEFRADAYSISEIYCPQCWGKLQYLPLFGWMKLFPGSKHYRCIKCKNRFLQIFRRLVEL